MSERVATSIRIILLIASTLTVMSGATIAPALPQINADFADVPNAALLSRLVLTMPALFIAAFSPVAGWITDRFGRKKLLLWGLGLYGISGTSGLYLDSLPAIIAGRAVLGIAVAFVMTTATTLISDYFKGESRNHFMGLQGAFMALGGVFYVSGGGILADISWRGPFAIYGIAFFLIPFAFRYIYEPAITRNGGSSGHPAAPLPRATIGLLFFVAFITMLIFYLVPVQLPFYLSREIGVSNTMVGLAISTMTLCSALVSFSFKRIKARLHFNSIFFLVFLIFAVGAFIISGSHTFWPVIAGLAVSGIGMGMFFPNLTLNAVAVTPDAYRGRVIAGITGFVFLGQFFSPIASQPMVEMFSFMTTFRYAALLLAALALFFAIRKFTRRFSSMA